MELNNTIKVTDRFGFVHSVEVKHNPPQGFSIAYWRGSPIADISYGRMLAPAGDDDGEWEQWQERFYEWIDGPNARLELDCKEYFDKQNH